MTPLIRTLMASDLQIRAAIVERLSERWRASPADIEADYIQPSLSPEHPTEIYVAFHDQKYIGEIMLCFYEDYYCGLRTAPVIGALFVPAEYRSRGIGRTLVTHVEAAAKSQGHHRLFLDTISAAKFWIGLGYEPIGEAVWELTGQPLAILGKYLRESCI